MFAFVFIIFSTCNLILIHEPSYKFEIQFRDGEVAQYNDFGKSSKVRGKLSHTFQIQQKASFFWLKFDYISEVTFKSIKEKTIVAKILLTSGKSKELEIIRDSYFCKKGNEIVEMPLASIKILKLIKL